MISLFEKTSSFKKFIHNISSHKRLSVKGLFGSGMSVFAASFYKNASESQLWVLENKESAAHFFNDLESFLGEHHVAFFPAAYRQSYQIDVVDNSNVLFRTKTLNKLHSSEKLIIVTYPDALFEKVVSQGVFSKNILTIKVGDKINLEFLNETLFEYHFRRVDFTCEPGEFSVRGGIIDVFSYQDETPCRIEFFGDEIESIRAFDLVSQLSMRTLDYFCIIPNIEDKTSFDKRESFFSSISPNTILFFKDLDSFSLETDVLFKKAIEDFKNKNPNAKTLKLHELFNTSDNHKSSLEAFKIIECSSSYNKGHITAIFHQQPQPPFNKKFNLLIQTLNSYHSEGFTCYITCANESQAKRFEDIFRDIGQDVHYEILYTDIYKGFIDKDSKVCCFTDHEIFNRYHKFKLDNLKEKKQIRSIKDYNALSLGDYVTHIDHGIGRFAGLEKIYIGDKKQEAIKIIYGDGDILYVSIHSLYKISKYSNKGSTSPPKVHKLGGKAWAYLKKKTKRKIKEIAFDLISLYAKRTSKKGFSFSPDSYLQHELEASFIYEDTPDQITVSDAVKADMESPVPMDRLVCGDVGFGKTEIAIRAAFKAVDNGKQVVILVPTTILAFQHWKTFSKRLEDFPVTTDYLNRFRTSKERSEIIKKLLEGKIDIIIGTHQLINKAIKFKDLGLLIVDEEQKFGVAVKEKLKTIRENIDVLTLTATPIPRTLQFSLLSARDLSIINTPPLNRLPIESRVILFKENEIKEAIMYEMQRGGQTFIVNDKIKNIEALSSTIRRLIPDVKIAIGHGQMEGKTLEKVMLDFMEGHYDVLISTTIIENGLDIPNANTIIINNAHHFGLSDLHQMRGRVGRSDRKAFCYLVTIPKPDMTDDARQRMSIIEQFSELGSGFNIAMKDLEIRGAGDLLGGEQSGFITDMGFDTYQKILQEAIKEIKDDISQEEYQEKQNIKYVQEVQIETDFEILFPDRYINSVEERLKLYNQLAELKNEEALEEFKKNLIDRFGPVTTEVKELLCSIHLKWAASLLGLERLVIKSHQMNAYFLSNHQSEYYNSPIFKSILDKVNNLSQHCKIYQRETKKGLKLILSFQKIYSIKDALQSLQTFL